MADGLACEPPEVLKDVAMAILCFQEPSFEREKLIRQLGSATIDRGTSTSTVVIFDLPHLRARNVEFWRTLDIEARVLDVCGQVLHAMIHLDEGDNLLALEVFPWEGWSGPLDVCSIEPVKFDESGLSKPS